MRIVHGLGGLLALLVLSHAAAARTPEQVFESASRSVVLVHGYDAEGNTLSQGSGVVTGRETVTTNCHVTDDTARVEVIFQSKTFSATPGAANRDRDLCQLKVPQLGAPRAALYTGRLRVGQRVYAIGAPEGLELTFTEGLISNLREFEGSRYIQTSAVIAQGSSGGGLFDADGRLIGITAFIVGEGQNLNFALPANWIIELTAAADRPAPKAPTAEAAEARWIARVAEARAQKDWVTLLTVAQQWVRTMPRSARAWQELGDAYRSVNRPRRAVPAYQQAVRYNAQAFDAWVHLGSSYLALNQYDRAIEASQEALRIKPAEPRALYNLGAAYHGQGLHERVQEIHAQLRKTDNALAADFARKYGKR
jgi:hypothetical protein